MLLGISSIKYSPLDTSMQAQIRNEMPSVDLKEYFVNAYKEGKLIKPSDSAKVLMDLLKEDTFENGKHIDFYDHFLLEQIN